MKQEQERKICNDIAPKHGKIILCLNIQNKNIATYISYD